ncbi:MAG: tRNA (adenosine(37)-N6)-threonylcarbamoyltransferase complex ATPase subunit type 1 TsaE [Acidimicrobiales bacterium]
MSETETIRARTTSAAETAKLAAALGAAATAGDLLLLSGDLGAGKTVFAQGFGSGLGVTEPIVSPTFTLVREYPGRVKLYHLDVYRLTHVQEALDLGLAELLDDDAVTLIEWGEQILPALPADYLEVIVELGDELDDERWFHLTAVGPRWSARARGLARLLAPWASDPGDSEATA